MENEMLCTGVAQNIDALIAECGITPEEQAKALFLVETAPHYTVTSQQQRQDLLRFAHYDPQEEFAGVTSGRIFHPDFELRWEKYNGKTHAVYLGNKRHLPSLDRDEKTQLDDYHVTRYYLFGERIKPEDLLKIGKPAQEGDFAELRIPRLLRYPDLPVRKKRVCLSVREYTEQATGQILAFRFQDLEPTE